MPDLHFPEGTHPQYWDFYDYCRIILNSGRYELRVVDSAPNWRANDGEMVMFNDTANNRKYLYMYVDDGWYTITFLTTATGGSAGTRFHHIGEIFGWGGSSTNTAEIPANCIVCNGAAVSRSGYPDLHAAIGNNFGAGDGSTTFNVPDARGRFLLGADNMGGTSANRITWAAADTVGGTGGNIDGLIDIETIAGDQANTQLLHNWAVDSTSRKPNALPPFQTINVLIQA